MGLVLNMFKKKKQDNGEIKTRGLQEKRVVVLGMHRSGTSMLAGILFHLGVNMGKELIGPMPSNPYGHFEDIRFVDLNDRILEAVNGSWYSPPLRDAVLVQQSVFSRRIQELVSTMEQGISGWKDPRTCLTVELYLEYLTNPFFIDIHRNPEEVAVSLQKRNRFSLQQGLELRREYEHRIQTFFIHHPDYPRLTLNYEGILADPEKHVSLIIDFLDMDPEDRKYSRAVNFVQS